MSSSNLFNFSFSDPGIPKQIIYVFLGIIINLTACEKENDCDCTSAQKYPSLQVVNQLTDSWRSIKEVSLVGYKYDNLNIEPNGGLLTFELKQGMSGGYEDINIKIVYNRYSGVSGTANIAVDFKNGETTIITLKGCSDGEGCSGIYLE